MMENSLAGPIIVVMGVAGSGKSTVGALLAAELHCGFLDGDSLHPANNIEKMSHGVPLTDEDRAPWLNLLHAFLADAYARGKPLVVACSALKQHYRDVLSAGVSVTWVYLKGSPELLHARLEHRENHFMKPAMLASQLQILEPPSDAVVADVSLPPAAIVEQIMARLREAVARSEAA